MPPRTEDDDDDDDDEGIVTPSAASGRSWPVTRTRIVCVSVQRFSMVTILKYSDDTEY